MELQAIEAALLYVAARAGIPVREEDFDQRLFGELGNRGGLCRLHGVDIIFLDRALSQPERVFVLSEALSRINLESIAMPPLIREHLEQHAQNRVRKAKTFRPKHLRRIR